MAALAHGSSPATAWASTRSAGWGSSARASISRWCTTPQEVQYSCIADGAAAATGASAGKLNLRLVDATEAAVATTYRRKSTGQSLTLRPSPAFVARFRDVPREQLAAAGRVVLALPDADIFEELPAAPSP